MYDQLLTRDQRMDIEWMDVYILDQPVSMQGGELCMEAHQAEGWGVVGGVVVEDAAGDLKVSNILHHQDLWSTNLKIVASSSINTLYIGLHQHLISPLHTFVTRTSLTLREQEGI